MIVVDAANVVGSRPDGWWRDRAGAAARLVASLAPLGEVTVVLEGKARAGVAEGSSGGVRVVHASGDGDEALALLCEPGVVLVTADRELRSRAVARGAQVQGPKWLLAQLPC